MRSLIAGGVGGAVVAAAMAYGGYQLGRTGVKQAAAPIIQAAAPVANDKQEIEKIVRDYLVANPEIVVEMQTALETKQREQQRLASVDAIKTSSTEIFKSPADAVIGNPNGKTTIVEFYDYNCGYCKRAFKDMQALTASDPDLRFVLKELPILGPDSQKAHLVSQAFHRLMPQKYAEFHNKLLGGEGRATEATAMMVALSLGADQAKLKAEMTKPDVAATLNKNFALAEKLAITGTPSYVVGDEVVFGALGQEVLGSKIANARLMCQTAAC